MVILIVSVLGGLGAGAYQVVRRNFAVEAAAGRVQGVIRTARNAAISTGVPAAVVVDPPSRTVRAVGFDPVGEWSFDVPADDPWLELGLGAFANRGAEEIEDGKIGRAARFANPPGVEGGSFVDCGRKPAFDLRTAVWCEAWVRHAGPPAAGARRAGSSAARPVRGGRGTKPREPVLAAAILEKAGAYFLGLAPDGALEGAIGDYRVRTGPGAVASERWVHVALRYDGRSLELRADGVPRAARPVADDGEPLSEGSIRIPETVPLTGAPVTISSPSRPFFGDVDEVRLAGATEPVECRLEEPFQFVGWKKVIRFDPRGHLDPKFHSEDVRIVIVEPLEEAESPKTGVPVDFSLTFDEWLERWDTPPPLRQSEEERRIEAGFGRARKAAVEVDRLGVAR